MHTEITEFTEIAEMKKFRTQDQLEKAYERGEIPPGCLSPAAVASRLDITRQAVYQRIKRGTLRAWKAPGITLVDPRPITDRLEEKGAVIEFSKEQGELRLSR